MSTLEPFLTAFVTFFVVIDPIGVAPIFVSLTAALPAAERRRVAYRGVTAAAVILLVFAVGGDALLRLLGISLAAFRIAGGALLFLTSIDMLFARDSGLRSTTQGEAEEAAHRPDVSIFPLAIPLIAGPAAITSVILQFGRHAGEPAMQLAVFGILLAVLTLNVLIFLVAERMTGWLGVTGVNVATRTFGVVLAALAAQFIIDGVAEVVRGLAAGAA